MAELAPDARKVADLRAREKDTRDNTREAEEKLTALIERACTDIMEVERLWKERDDLLWAVEGLRTEHDLASQGHADA